MAFNLYSKDGQLRLTIPLSDNCIYHDAIGGDCYVGISAVLTECVGIAVGDYGDWEGMRFWATEAYQPRQEAEQQWSYSFNLYGTQSIIKGALMLSAIGTPLFALTAPAIDHVKLVVKNINRWLGKEEWSVGEVITTKPLVIDYSAGVYANEAMAKIAQEANTEWWVEGTSIHLGRCLRGEPLTLGYRHGARTIEAGTSSNVKFFSRLFPIGSSRNIDPDRYGDTRLHLPSGAHYVERGTELGIVEHYEAEAFSHIYPRRVGTIGGVRSKEVTSSEGKPYTIYYVKDADLPFNPDEYSIAGLVKHIIFQSGDVAGVDFECNYLSQSGEIEIITQWPYSDDTQLPNAILAPKVGDTYALYNLRMPDEYYRLAEQELQEAVERYMDEHCVDNRLYKVATDYIDLAQRGAQLRIGQRIILQSSRLFAQGTHASRITALSIKMARPTDADIEVSEVISRTTQSKLQDDVRSLYTEVREAQATLPNIIRSWETTTPTDNNLYSARATGRHFLRKDMPDTATGHITLEDGVSFGQYKGGLLGKGGRITAKGDGELRNLRLWESLEVPELRYNRVSIYTGIRWDTFGGGIVESCSPTSPTAGGLYLKIEDGEVGAIAEGDLCMGIWHDMAGGNETATTDDRHGRFTFAGFRTVYFRIDSIPATDPDGRSNSDGHYCTYILREGTSTHPYATMHFAGRGNVSNPQRQAFTYTTTEYSLQLAGVNAWEFTEDNYKQIHGNLNGFALSGKAFAGYGGVLKDVHVYGSIEQFDNAPLRIEYLTTHGTELLEGEATTITPTLLQGYNPIRDGLTWTLRSETGQEIAPTQGSFVIRYTDLRDEAQTTLFTLTATSPQGQASQSIAIRRLRNGSDAKVFVVEIEQGSQFYRAEQTFIARLRALLIDGDKDITTTLHPSQIRWTRESQGDDTAWDTAHASSFETIDITTADMAGETTIVCTLYDESGRIASSRKIAIE